jgi:predicted ester cyclase
MSVEKNKALVRRLVEEGWRDPDVLDEIVAPDFVWHHDPEGREAYKGAWSGWFAGLPDCRIVIADMVAEGDRVVIRCEFSGTHTGTLWGIPPTNNKVSFEGFHAFRIAGGKIVEQWLKWDMMGLFRQLGIVPSWAELIQQAQSKHK